MYYQCLCRSLTFICPSAHLHSSVRTVPHIVVTVGELQWESDSRSVGYTEAVWPGTNQFGEGSDHSKVEKGLPAQCMLCGVRTMAHMHAEDEQSLTVLGGYWRMLISIKYMVPAQALLLRYRYAAV